MIAATSATVAAAAQSIRSAAGDPPAPRRSMDRDHPLTPLLQLHRHVVFPRGVLTLVLTRPENLAALRAASSEGLIAVPRLDPRGRPTLRKLAAVGTRVRVLDRLTLQGRRVRLVVQGIERVRLSELVSSDGVLRARTESGEPPADAVAATGDAIARALSVARSLGAVAGGRWSELSALLEAHADDAARLTDVAAGHAPFELDEQVRLLEETAPAARLAVLVELLQANLVRAEVGHELDHAVRIRIRHEDLRKRYEAIRAELGDRDPHAAEADELAARLARTPLDPRARRAVERELAHFRRAAPTAPEAGRIRAYLEFLLELPWNRASAEPTGGAAGFARVAEALDKSHCALDDVKKRVIEFLAVRHLRRDPTGTVLCFIGPPGTGKSSMGRAVAAALGREIVEVQVGGITEECELLGIPHRQQDGRPGLLLSGIHRAGTRNPVLLIDELDKLGFGADGSAAGALLQILDPEQNNTFHDAYLGLPWDLSQCLLVVTANDAEQIPEALLDRLEIIEFSGYTESEKLAIARRHLIPRARRRAALRASQFSISPAAQRTLLRSYTEEAGVRHLQRLLDSLSRKAAIEVVRGRDGLSIRRGDLLGLLGPAIVDEEFTLRRPAIGIATGLAWTSAGGSLLPIEALAMPGTGRTILTGQIGEVMRESVQTAISFIRTCFPKLGIVADHLDSLDIHLHFPSGATPKDGPSAGIAIATAVMSLVAKVPARHDVALTGEMSLHGNVLPVGGIRDKLLAAVRSGLRAAVVPSRNSEEVLRLPGEIRSHLDIHLVDHIRDVFDLALVRRIGIASGGSRSAGPRRTVRRARPPRQTGA